MIDWSNPKDKVSKYFSVKEAIYLPQWSRLANDTDGLDDTVKNNLITLFSKMDEIRDQFNAPINVHVTYRPEAYNALVGGAKNSSHKAGMACDFDVKGYTCDDVRSSILASETLQKQGVRMEDLEGASWVHIDIREPGPAGRYFKP